MRLDSPRHIREMQVTIVKRLMYRNSGLFFVHLAMLCCLVLSTGYADAGGEIEDIPSPPIDRIYAPILKKAVTTDGLVRYDVLRQEPQRRNLQWIVGEYSRADLPQGKNEKLAFLCNAYNANVLDMVVAQSAQESFKSVNDVPGFFDTLTVTVAGKTMTLNDLENDHIRPLGDPRIHAALVCAAMSCPPLRAEPYTAKQLDKQLSDQSRRWINDRTKFIVDEQGLGVSMIMQWYGKDFSVAPYGSVVGFIRKFAEPTGPIGRLLSRENDPPVHFLKYDWRLNRARPA